MKRILVPALSLLALVGLAGCTMQVDMSTTVAPGGVSIEQVVTNTIDASADDEEMDILKDVEEGTKEEDGWTIVTTKKDRVATTRGSKLLKPGDTLMPQGENAMFKDATLDLVFEEADGVRTYKATIVIPPSPQSGDANASKEPVDSPTPTMQPVGTPTPAPKPAGTPTPGQQPAASPTPEKLPVDDTQDMDMSAIMDALIQITWTLNMPGEVVETNADEQTETGGIWHLTNAFQQKGGELKLITREQIQ